jgi:hypothetical protein
VKGILAENLYMSAYSSKGHYNDMDMLEVGVNKWGSSLTDEEAKTHFGMWCIMNSPLLIGCDMRNLSTANLNLLKNTELIALNQDPLYQQAYLASKVNGCFVMVKDIEVANSTKRAFAIYNPNDEAKTVTLNFKDIDLAGNVALRDVYLKSDAGSYTESFQVTVPKHGAKIYVADADTRLERTRYEAETGYSEAYTEIDWNKCQYSEAANCSGGYKAGWLGNSEKNSLQWRNVYSKTGGKYQLTIAYICGENRNITVSVNGKKVKTQSYNSGSWNTVGTKSLEITLEQGDNVIRLSNASGWMPDLDYIDLTLLEPSGVEEVKAAARHQHQTLFDLQGRKVSDAHSHGIVISNNGKKFVK